MTAHNGAVLDALFVGTALLALFVLLLVAAMAIIGGIITGCGVRGSGNSRLNHGFLRDDCVIRGTSR